MNDGFPSIHRSKKDALRKLLKRVEGGSVFLLKSDPFSPVVRWVEEDGNPLKGKWVPTDYSVNFHVKHAISNAESEARLKLRTIEYEKERTLVKEPSAGIVRPSKPITKKPDPVPSATLTAAISAALVNSRSVSEALGKAGMEEAKTRLGYATDPRYIDRYHGPDDMTKHNETNRLAEMESKGNKTDSTAIAKDVNMNKQCSSDKNATRATLMIKNKSKKIGIPSNRQGGAYTRDEIDLWKEIDERGGHKQHISCHTNTETGNVKVLERDSDGNKEKTLDEFKMKNFDVIKKGIKKVIKK